MTDVQKLFLIGATVLVVISFFQVLKHEDAYIYKNKETAFNAWWAVLVICVFIDICIIVDVLWIP